MALRLRCSAAIFVMIALPWFFGTLAFVSHCEGFGQQRSEQQQCLLSLQFRQFGYRQPTLEQARLASFPPLHACVLLQGLGLLRTSQSWFGPEISAIRRAGQWGDAES